MRISDWSSDVCSSDLVAVRIRGASSVNAGTSPLYVIDGLPIDNSQVAAGGGANFDSSPSPRNPLAGINPEDIESLEILKAASATAIYGSRGANGVIMVTDRKSTRLNSSNNCASRMPSSA